MRQPRHAENTEEREQRLRREAQMKTDKVAANEAVIDRIIRRNIEQYGP